MSQSHNVTEEDAAVQQTVLLAMGDKDHLALDIINKTKLKHEVVYQALVGLENAGRVRLIILDARRLWGVR